MFPVGSSAQEVQQIPVKRIGLAFAVLAVLFLAGGTTALATDEVSVVATALKSSAVYIAPNVPGSSPDTASNLQQQLSSDDHVAVVMLPKEALSQTGGDIQAFARQLDAATGHKLIIGLAAGDQYIGYSSLLPNGVAADLMSRAASVSTSVPETLQTFIRTVHDWERANPTAIPTKPPAKGQASGPPIILVILGAAFVVGVAAFLLLPPLTRSSVGTDHVKFQASPDSIRDKLRHIQDLRAKINDPALQSAIADLCRHCEMYFKRNRGRASFDDDVSTFEQHLDSIIRVLERYIDVQDNGEYYRNPASSMREGLDAVRDYANSVLEAIRQGTGNRAPRRTSSAFTRT